MIISFLIIIFLCMCSSCTTTKVVTVEKVRTDTLLSYSSIRDSIYLHDSTFIREKGDTVLIERWHTKYIDRTVHDTLYKSKTDSVPVPVPITEYVKRELTWWQQTRLHIANILLWALLIVGVVWIIKKKFLP